MPLRPRSCSLFTRAGATAGSPHPGDFVICADEKSQLQALGRRDEAVPAGPGRPALVEFECRRGGALAYLAAWDVHHARLFDRFEPGTGIEPFGRLVEQVMASEPHRSARRVFWIVDNGSSRAGRASVGRMQAAWANTRLIHLPIHASWLNQIELFFSIVQRKALTPDDFASLDEPAERLLAFGEHYRQVAQPFHRTFCAPTSTRCWPVSPAASPTFGSRPDPPGRQTALRRQQDARRRPSGADA